MKARASFVTSAGSVGQLPPEGPPEVAFAGRSNVGKSSLLNALAGASVAKVSKTPGRTRTINFFDVWTEGSLPGPDLAFVDLPGYGFARRSKAERETWKKLVEGYLERRKALGLCVLLIDANVPPQDHDSQMLDWLRHAGVPFLLVATKADRLKKSKRLHTLNSLARAHGAEVIAVSARTGSGMEEMWRRLLAIVR